MKNTSKPTIHKQISIEPFLDSSSLDDSERVVVEVLAKHYNRTGSKFFWVSDYYEAAERFHLNPAILSEVLRKLDEENIVYVWPRTRYPKKIGLKKEFVKKLKVESSLGV